MRVSFRPLKPSDFYELDVYERHAWALTLIKGSPTKLIPHVMADTFSFCMEVDGKPKALCGILKNGGCWALLSKNMKRYMLCLHRYVMSINNAFYSLHGEPWAEVNRTDPAAVRWVEILGYRKIRPAGGDLDLWAYAPV